MEQFEKDFEAACDKFREALTERLEKDPDYGGGMILLTVSEDDIRQTVVGSKEQLSLTVASALTYEDGDNPLNEIFKDSIRRVMTARMSNS
jgi:hypothetical protein